MTSQSNYFKDFDRYAEMTGFWENAKISAAASSHEKARPLLGMMNSEPKTEQDRYEIASNNMQLAYLNVIGQFLHYGMRQLDTQIKNLSIKIDSLDSKLNLLINSDVDKKQTLENVISGISTSPESSNTRNTDDHLWLSTIGIVNSQQKIEPSAPPLPQDEIWENVIKKIDPEKSEIIKQEVDQEKQKKFTDIIKNVGKNVAKYGYPLATYGLLGMAYSQYLGIGLPWLDQGSYMPPPT